MAFRLLETILGINDTMNLRKEYKSGKLTDEMAGKDPFVLFGNWYTQAQNEYGADAPAMSLATATADGKPSCRVVLLKSFDRNGFVFFTNYQSRKGRELTENPNAALCFFWPLLEKQVRVEGKVRVISTAESDLYFTQRPLESQAASIVSLQSKVLVSREILEEKFRELVLKANNPVLARPAYWGGYILEPEIFEFWQGREFRLNDRIVFSLKANGWLLKRLFP